MLLTPRHLSGEGRGFRRGGTCGAGVVASGQQLGTGDIRGVLTRLPAVSENELPHIAPEDRQYVAAEMTAFLLAFLTELPVRVVNRPTPLCLCGQYWRDEKWRHVAHSLGLATRPAHRKVKLGAVMETESSGTVVTVVGDSCVGGPMDGALFEAARVLALAAAADLLAVEFDSARADAAVQRASPLLDLSDPPIASAILALFDVNGKPREAGDLM